MGDELWDKLAKDEYGKEASAFLQKVNRREKTQIESIIKKQINLGKEMIVLDAGCGKGRWAFLFSEKVRKVIGVDLSEKSIAIAEKKNVKNIEFRKANITDLSFLEDNSIDLSFLCITLQHIVNEDEFKKVVSELERVTKPGGRIAFIEIVKKYSKKRGGYIDCRSPAEYVNAFKNSKLVKQRGTECPYLKFIYRGIIRKLLKVKRIHGDVQDEYALWDAMEKSKIRILIYIGYSVVMLIGSFFSLLSRRILFLSPQRLFIFEVKE